MNHDHSNANGNKHLLLMLACCLIPLALILAIGVFGISLGSLTPLLPYALILLCPLMMFFMMRGMGTEHGAAETHPPETARALSTGPQAVSQAEAAHGETGHEHCH